MSTAQSESRRPRQFTLDEIFQSRTNPSQTQQEQEYAQLEQEAGAVDSFKSLATFVLKSCSFLTLIEGQREGEGTASSVGAPAILRCTLCYTWLLKNQKRVPVDQLEGGGLILSPDRLDTYRQRTKGRGFRQFKHRIIKDHCNCATHLRAFGELESESEQLNRHMTAAKALVTSGLSVVLSGTGATQYEGFIAMLYVNNVYIGDKQHGRKVSRTTNQAVMACAFHGDGVRRAYCLGAPDVYSGADASLSGGQATALANSAVTVAKSAGLHLECCGGVAADGQYQTDKFQTTMQSLLQEALREADSVESAGTSTDCIDGAFYGVVWDAAHWLNLVVTDIRKSSAPIQRMIASLNWLHRKIQRGKILVKAYQVAERIHDRRARKTKSFSKTRFVSSSFTMVQATVTELRIWLTTLNETPLSRKNREVLAYLQSTAFVTELLIFSEVMKPFCATMLRCQDLQLPVWSMVEDISRLSVELEQKKTALSQLHELANMDRELDSFASATAANHDLRQHLPLLFTNLTDLQQGVYHDVDLATTTTVPRCILDRRCRHVSDSEDSSSDSESDSELEVRHAGRNVRSTFKSALSAGVELVTALGDRLSVRTSHSIPSFINLLSSAFGLAGYVGAMCGRLRRGSSGATVFLRHEAHFVVYGRNAFSMAAEAARSRRSLRDLFDSADLQPVDLHTLWRDTLKQIVWSEDSTSAHCRRVLFGDTVPDDRVLTLALTEVSDEFAIDFGQGPVKLKVQEQAFIKAMYNDDQLYTRFGKPLCALLDWALAKGCPEAIVESLYTSMERQCMQGALQLSSTLELRTRLAWHLPRTLAAIPTNVLERISREWLTSHPVTFLSAGSNKRKQEVLERLKSEEGRVRLK
uniref:ANK_REP_REGION domain-containing protein n=1 Tax=Macrostomum lignano TaxID=282301 RepID=A0A1I8H9C9_9PLAT